MFYEFRITTDASTTEASPKRTVYKLTHGVITKASIQFPNGSAGLLRCRVKLGGALLWPRNVLSYISGDGNTIPITEYAKVYYGHNRLEIITWNNSTRFSREVIIRVMVLPEEVVNQTKIFSDIRKALILLLRRIGVRL